MELFTNERYVTTQWQTGDLITAEKLNKIEDALQDLDQRVVENVVGGSVDADKIMYTTSSDSSISTVKDALDKLLYSDLVINLTCNKSTTVEKGENLTSIMFEWTYSKGITSQTFNGESIDKAERSYLYSGPLTADKTFILKANDGTKDFTKNISFSFLNGVYWGVSTEKTYDSTFVRSLSKALSKTKNKTITVDCGEGQYIYYCIPSSFGTPNFTVGGFSGGFSKVSTIQYTNMYNHTESYDIWKSTNSGLGTTTVVVN